jgi:hypothetical protein
MGFNDLKILIKKDKVVYFILLIWVIFGTTLYQFGPENFWFIVFRYLVFTLFICTTLLYMIFSFILREKAKKHPYAILIICFILAFPVWFYLLESVLGLLVFTILYLFTLFYWFVLTTIFAMNDIFNRTERFDVEIKNWSKPLNSITRYGLFFGGIFIAFILTFIALAIALSLGAYSETYDVIIWNVFLYTNLAILILFIIGIITLLGKKKNLWLGIFLIFIACYGVYLIFKAAVNEYGFMPQITLLVIIVYIFNLYLLLTSVASLISEQADLITKKLSFIKRETLLIWLIFSLGMYQFGSSFSGQDMVYLELIYISMFFPIIAVIFGIYAIVKHGKKQVEIDKEQKEASVQVE